MATKITLFQRHRRSSRRQGTHAYVGPAMRLVQAGGTLDESAIYIERAADQLLYRRLRRGEFCLVLAARQVGKSSLRDRVAKRLEAEGILCAQIDLSGTGGDAITILDPDKRRRQEDDWLYSRALQIIDEVAPKLKSDALRQLDMGAAWDALRGLEPARRWAQLLRDHVLAACVAEGRRLVVLIDEIDVLLSYGWRDNFFSTVRMLYNERARLPVYKSVTFCLVGLALPTELMSQAEQTPFNVGEPIDLTDFGREELEPFETALSARHPEAGKALLDAVFAWTRGHPYMTQKLCKELLEPGAEALDPGARVAELARKVFVHRGREREPVIQYAERYLLTGKSRFDLQSTLTEYGRVLAAGGLEVPTSGLSDLQMPLRFSGIVAHVGDDERRRLEPRNKVFEEVFNLKWVLEKLPDPDLAQERWRQDAANSPGGLRVPFLSDILRAARSLLLSNPPPPTSDPKVGTGETTLSRLRAQLRRTERGLHRRSVARLLIVILVLLVAAATFGALFWQRRRGAIEAERRRLAEAAGIAAKEGRELDALVLALESAAGPKAPNAERPSFAVEALARAVSAARRSYPIEAPLSARLASFSEGGRYGITIGGRRGVVWDLTERVPTASFDLTEDLAAAPVLAPNGAEARGLTTGGLLWLWKAGSAPWCQDRRGHKHLCETWSIQRSEQRSVERVVFSPTLGHFAMLSRAVQEDNPTRVRSASWSVDAASPQVPFPYDLASDGAFDFSPDGARFAFLGRSWDLHVCRTDTWEFDAALSTLSAGEPRAGESRPPGAVVAYSPDGKRLACAVGASVRVWDTKTGHLTQEITAPARVAKLRFGPGQVVTITRDREAIAWDEARAPAPDSTPAPEEKEPREDGRPLVQRRQRVDDIVFSPVDPDGFITLAGGLAHLAFTRQREQVGVQQLFGSQRTTSVGFTAGGQPLTIEAGRTLRLWNLPAGRLQGHGGQVTSLTVFKGTTPAEDRLVTAAADGAARVFRTDGSLVRATPGAAVPATAAALSPSGEWLFVGYEDGSARVFSAERGELTASFHCHRERITSFDFSADGLTATGSLDGTVSVVTPSGYPVLTVRGGEPGIAARGLFSPDGERILVYGGAGSVALHEIPALDGARLAPCEDPESLPDLSAPPHEQARAAIVAAAFTPRGEHAVLVGDDNRLYVIDAKTCAPCEGRWWGDGKAPVALSAAFAPELGLIAVGTEMGTVEIWSLPSDMAGKGAESALSSLSDRRGTGAVREITFSPDGAALSAVTESGYTRLYHLTRRPEGSVVSPPPLVFPSDGGPATRVVFTPDGTSIATASGDERGSVRLDPATEEGLFRAACALLVGPLRARAAPPKPAGEPEDPAPGATYEEWERASEICKD